MKRRPFIWIAAALTLLALLLLLVVIGDEEAPFAVGAPLSAGKAAPALDVSHDGRALLLAPDGSLWFWGGSASKPLAGRPGGIELPERLSGGNDWRAVVQGSAGGVVALKADGSLWNWNFNRPSGTNAARQFGAPVQVGTDTNWSSLSCRGTHYMALKNDGSLWGWGQNDSGQLGNGTSSDQTSQVPERVGTDRNWKAIAAGAFNSHALKQDGTLWGWGASLASGSNKTNDVSPRLLDSGTNWLAIAAGDFHLLALKSDGTIWLRGQNSYSTARDFSVPGEKLFQIGKDNDWNSIVSGQNCFFARKWDGSWWVCGDNTSRKLGIGEPIVPRPPRAGAAQPPRAGGRGPAAAPASPVRFRSPGAPERLPLDFEPWAFGSGGKTTLLLTRDGTLWTWGDRLGSKQSVLAQKGLKGIYQNVIEWLRGVFRPKSQNQAQLTGLLRMNSGSEIVDSAPHKLWVLPAEVRSALGTNATSNPAR